MLFGKERILPIVQMPDGRCCSCSERQHMLTMRPLDAHGKWQGKTQKEYLCAKPMRNAALRHRSFYRQKRTAGKSSSSTGIQRVCRRGLRPHRPPASRGGGAARSSRKRRNLGVKTRCVRVGTARSNCWIGEKRGGCVNRALKEKQQPARVTHPQQKFTGRYRPLLPWMIFCSQKLNSARNKLQQTPVTMLFSLGNQQNLHAELLHRKIRCCGKHPIGQAVLKPAAV